MTATNPAATGETLIVYFDGATVEQFPPASAASPASPPLQCASFRNPVARVGTADAAVEFCGLTPGFVGLSQLNIVVPSGLASGTYNLQIGFDRPSSNVVSLPVR